VGSVASVGSSALCCKASLKQDTISSSSATPALRYFEFCIPIEHRTPQIRTLQNGIERCAATELTLPGCSSRAAALSCCLLLFPVWLGFIPS